MDNKRGDEKTIGKGTERIKIFNNEGGNMKQSKLDLTKEYKTYYTAKATSEFVEIGEGKFLTIEGKGTPGGDEFQAKVRALYSLVYGIKMLMKKEGKDFIVAKLEGKRYG